MAEFSASPSSASSSTTLVQTVSNRSLLDQAKGALVLRLHVPPDTALHLLREWARELSVDTLTVARTLVYGVGVRDFSRRWDRAVLTHLCAELGEPPPPKPTLVRVPLPRVKGLPTRRS